MNGGDGFAAPRRRPMRRALLWASGLTIVALVFGAGWTAANVFQSPEQRAAGQAPPEMAVITSEVTRGPLEETINAQASVQRRSNELLAVRPGPDANTVVTATPVAAGDQVQAGQVLIETNGRPVIAVPGRFPFYRDLTPGDEGPDVRQLQDGLVGAGYSLTSDGVFGPATVSALTSMYQRAGYDVPLADAPAAGESPAVAERTAPADDKAAGTPLAAPSATPTPAPTPEKTVVVPVNELIAVSSLPAQITSVPRVGATVNAESAIGVSSGEFVTRAEVAESVVNSIPEGTPTTIAGEDGAIVIAEVTSVTLGEAGENATVTLAPTEGAIPEDWGGTTVLATFTLQTIAGDALIVPSSSVQHHGDGHSFVLKQTGAGEFEEIAVEEIGWLAGRSAIEPRTDGALDVGDLVRVE